MLKLYREAPDGLRYWEAWPEDGPRVTVHEGRVGERGRSWTVEGVDDWESWVAEAARPKRGEGFAEIELDDHAYVIVQIPARTLPMSTEELDALWSRLEHFLNETLGWTGLGRCGNVDLGGPLTAFGDVVDLDLGLAVLSAAIADAGLPDDAVIADQDHVIRWPSERAGESVEPF